MASQDSNILPGGGNLLIMNAFMKATEAYNNVPDGPGCMKEGERLYEATLLKEVAALAETHGLVATLNSLHAFYAAHAPRRHLPPALSFLEGHKSHWAWLHGELLRYQSKLRKDFIAKFRSENPGASQVVETMAFSQAMPNIWVGLLQEHNLDDETYSMWSHIELDSLEEGVEELFVRVVISELCDSPASSEIADLVRCRVQFSNDISFILPEWEATAILEKNLAGIIAYVDDLGNHNYPPGYVSDDFKTVADLYSKFI